VKSIHFSEAQAIYLLAFLPPQTHAALMKLARYKNLLDTVATNQRLFQETLEAFGEESGPYFLNFSVRAPPGFSY
jgi:hypothetical protein